MFLKILNSNSTCPPLFHIKSWVIPNYKIKSIYRLIKIQSCLTYLLQSHSFTWLSPALIIVPLNAIHFFGTTEYVWAKQNYITLKEWILDIILFRATGGFSYLSLFRYDIKVTDIHISFCFKHDIDNQLFNNHRQFFLYFEIQDSETQLSVYVPKNPLLMEQTFINKIYYFF